ncbi:hypothetical protein [Tepidibacter aestuarii]|uniref:hypothetical protein n=1 Tax=Tepidibacter aestuarii TaxID=2925782 RepID=UPI0020C09A4F|nr:hypothetical protein [Tepidibacter aestuarii]CAH2214994.1 conserved exported protein of unknown function [Tepidibacter aestuarii]
MLKDLIRNKVVISILSCSIIVTSTYIVKASGYEPGSSGDPVVTKSYVDMKIDELAKNVTEVIENINTNKQKPDTEVKPEDKSSNELEIVQIEAGQSIILESGSEIILRGGEGSIIDSELGGIADLTQGIDLRGGYDVPANHLLMVPRSDGRGIVAKTNCIFMVKGGYEVK